MKIHKNRLYDAIWKERHMQSRRYIDIYTTNVAAGCCDALVTALDTRNAKMVPLLYLVLGLHYANPHHGRLFYTMFIRFKGKIEAERDAEQNKQIASLAAALSLLGKIEQTLPNIQSADYIPLSRMLTIICFDLLYEECTTTNLEIIASIVRHNPVLFQSTSGTFKTTMAVALKHISVSTLSQSDRELANSTLMLIAEKELESLASVPILMDTLLSSLQNEPFNDGDSFESVQCFKLCLWLNRNNYNSTDALFNDIVLKLWHLVNPDTSTEVLRSVIISVLTVGEVLMRMAGDDNHEERSRIFDAIAEKLVLFLGEARDLFDLKTQMIAADALLHLSVYLPFDPSHVKSVFVWMGKAVPTPPVRAIRGQREKSVFYEFLPGMGALNAAYNTYREAKEFIILSKGSRSAAT